MLGIRETPTEVQTVVLIDYVRGSLARFSMDDFKIAFTLFCENKLDESREHFQTLSPLYLGRVMESYSRYRFRYLKQNTGDEQEKQLSEEEKYYLMKNACLDAFKNYKKTKRIIDFGSVKYLFLERMGIIKYTAAYKKEILGIAVKQLEKELSKDGEIKINIETILPDDIITRSRELALKIFFDNLIEMEIDLKERFHD